MCLHGHLKYKRFLIHTLLFYRPNNGEDESKNSIITDQIAIGIVSDVRNIYCTATYVHSCLTHIISMIHVKQPCILFFTCRLLLPWNTLLLINMSIEMWQHEIVWVSNHNLNNLLIFRAIYVMHVCNYYHNVVVHVCMYKYMDAFMYTMYLLYACKHAPT